MMRTLCAMLLLGGWVHGFSPRVGVRSRLARVGPSGTRLFNGDAEGEEGGLQYEDLEPGDVIEVIADDITFWHPPKFRKDGVNPKGWQGIFCKNKIDWMDAVTTANRPVMVQVYEPQKCICHFELHEIKLVRKADDETRALVPKRKV